MILPVQITYRNIVSTPNIEKAVRDRARKLERFYSPITSCRVLLNATARHHRNGRRFNVRIDVTIPDAEIVVTREPTLYAAERQAGVERNRKKLETQPESKRLNLAIHEAFDAVGRRLQDRARRRRVDVKTHEATPEARVTKLFPVQGYGYCETPDGREIYFHANSVMNEAFKDLKIGSKVAFAEEPGEKGPQASTVRIIGKPPAKALPPVRTRRSSGKKT